MEILKVDEAIVRELLEDFAEANSFIQNYSRVYIGIKEKSIKVIEIFTPSLQIDNIDYGIVQQAMDSIKPYNPIIIGAQTFTRGKYRIHTFIIQHNDIRGI